MSRLIRSSRFHAIIVGIIIEVLLAVGMPANLADSATPVLQWIVGGLVALYIASTSLEDAAAKLKQGTAKGLLLLLMLLPCLPACSFFSPGRDTRTAHEANSLTEWKSDGSLWMEKSSTQDTEYMVAEGTAVSVTMPDDGSYPVVTGATNLLWERYRPTTVADSYRHLADKNLAAWERTMQTVDAFLPLLAARMQALEQKSSEIERLLNLLSAAQKLVPAPAETSGHVPE